MEEIINLLTLERKRLSDYLDNLDLPENVKHAISIADRMDRITAVINDLKLGYDD